MLPPIAHMVKNECSYYLFQVYILMTVYLINIADVDNIASTSCDL